MSGDIPIWGGAAVTLDGWGTSAAPGSRAGVAAEGGAVLRFDFALAGERSWAIARRALATVLPSHWVLELRLRGEGPPNELQVKLVDPDGANVWWWRRTDYRPSRESERLVFRRASLEFAWGPASGGDPKQLGAVEIAVAAGPGGVGTLWIEEMRIVPRTPAAGAHAVGGVRASSSVPGHEPERALDDAASPGWSPAPDDAAPWLEFDLGAVGEWGGLVADFSPAAPATRLVVSDNGVEWTARAENAGGAGGRRWLAMGESESRLIRLEFPHGFRGEIARVAVVPIELAVSPARWASTRARAAPRGHFPRHLLGEQAYWAVVGGDGDERKGLLGEDGALEVDAESFTLEPFLWTDGRLLTWADVERSASLADGCLPVPSVEWGSAGLRLGITAFVTGERSGRVLVACYTVENRNAAPAATRLYVAVRPYQVTPAWQRLGLVGAVAPISRLERAGAVFRVNDAREVVAVTAPDAAGVATSGAGAGVRALAEGRVPSGERADDPLGLAEGAFAFDLRLDPGRSEAIVIAVPFHPTPIPAGCPRVEAAAWGAARAADAISFWRARLGRLPFALPPSGALVVDSARASLGWILVNRDGPRIQPGPRCYRRSWIRDGSITATALAEMGFADEARDFLRWYAPHQYEDGRVPCAVDRREVDPTVEHDSHGQLVWGVAEVYRLTGDESFLRDLWPRVLRAVEAIARLRAERTGDAFRGTPSFGLLPESISHEGYASRPVHAYWDDFFALAGLGAAADAARALADPAAAARIGALRDAMRSDVQASIAAIMARRGVDFVPGSVELADFDPTSTAIAFDPCDEADRLPRDAIERTFERYWQEFEARRSGATAAEAFTPYELRNVVALLGLGWKERALALLDWLVEEQRPAAWRQWPEVVWRDDRGRFLGDLPHGWVASTYLRAVRRLFAYERAVDGALVVAAGVREAWVREAPGVRVHGLATRFGSLDFTMRAEDDGRVRVALGGRLRCPPGGIVVASPLPPMPREVWVDGRPLPGPHAACVRLRELPAEVVFSY